jgi:hypothetical protein
MDGQEYIDIRNYQNIEKIVGDVHVEIQESMEFVTLRTQPPQIGWREAIEPHTPLGLEQSKH